MHHKAAGAGVHHADRAQRQQRHRLHGVAQFCRIVEIIRRQGSYERFVNRSKQRACRQCGVLRRQVPGAHRGPDPQFDLA